MKKVKAAATDKQLKSVQADRDAAQESSMTGSVAGSIWAEIKDKPIDMFALSNQKVSMHCHPVNIEPTKLYLLANSSAVLPALETAVGGSYQVDLADRFITVSRAITKLTK